MKTLPLSFDSFNEIDGVFEEEDEGDNKELAGVVFGLNLDWAELKWKKSFKLVSLMSLIPGDVDEEEDDDDDEVVDDDDDEEEEDVF